MVKTTTAKDVRVDAYLNTRTDGYRPSDFTYGAYGVQVHGELIGKVRRPNKTATWVFTPTDEHQDILDYMAQDFRTQRHMREQIAEAWNLS